MQTHLTPHRVGRRSPLELVLAALLAGLLLAQPVLADADPAPDQESATDTVSDAADAPEAAEAEVSDASEKAAAPDSESEEAVAPESRTMEIVNKTFDVVALRPAQAVMAGVGTILFVPAALLASPGGRESIEEALDRFVIIPVESAFQRPLGEF